MSSKIKRKKKNNHGNSKWPQRFLVLILLIGLGLLLYPSVSNWVNTRASSSACAKYIESVEKTADDHIQKIFNEAENYNQNLYLTASVQNAPHSSVPYEEQLKLDESDVMGTLTIPAIDVSLPIYHGTSEKALMSGVGHLQGSSLPIGGVNTHTVLTGHRGMPSAQLLTRLDELEKGDTFVIRTLGKVLTYQVDSIFVVVPDDMSRLKIKTGEDLATLVTCTPYGVNSHRLLVQGHRVSDDFDISQLTGEAKTVDRRIVALWIGCPILLIIFLVWYIAGKKKGKGIDYEEVDTEDF